MGRFDGFLLLWERLLLGVGITPQPWMLPALLLLLGAVSWPWVRRTQRIGRARKALARADRAHGEERRQHQQAALDLVGDHPMGLVGVVEEALRRHQSPLAADALERLQATGKERVHVKRLEARVYGPPPVSIEAELAAVERLLVEGMVAQACGRLARARRRWPDEPRLLELGERAACARERPPSSPRG